MVPQSQLRMFKIGSEFTVAGNDDLAKFNGGLWTKIRNNNIEREQKEQRRCTSRKRSIAWEAQYNCTSVGCEAQFVASKIVSTNFAKDTYRTMKINKHHNDLCAFKVE